MVLSSLLPVNECFLSIQFECLVCLYGSMLSLEQQCLAQCSRGRYGTDFTRTVQLALCGMHESLSYGLLLSRSKLFKSLSPRVK